MEYPILGQGTAFNKQVITREILQSIFPANTWMNFNNPHNQYLSDLLMYGIVGFSFLAFLLSYLIYRALKYHDVALFLVVLTFMLFMVNESPLERSHSQLMFTILSSILIYSQDIRCKKMEIK